MVYFNSCIYSLAVRMSIRKFFTWTGQRCLNFLKSIRTSIQNQYARRTSKDKRQLNPALSIATFPRSSTSTDATFMDFELGPCTCSKHLQKEDTDNHLNEVIEKRWRCKY